jgi:hypothetical protein
MARRLTKIRITHPTTRPMLAFIKELETGASGAAAETADRRSRDVVRKAVLLTDNQRALL